MARGCGLLLLAFAALMLVLCGVGTLVMLGELPRQGVFPLLVFLTLDVVAITLLVVAVVVLRRTKPWTGPSAAQGGDPTDRYPANQSTAHDLDGVAYHVHYTPPVKGKHARPSVLTFSAPVACSGEFAMAAETWFDRLCKRWGIAVEVETGDAAFDEGCYVRSDTPAFAEAYLSDPLKRTAILDLRRFGFLHVALRDGKLSVVRHGFDPVADDRPEFSAEVAARLVLLARNLPAHQPEFDERTGSGRRTGQVVLWALLLGFALTAVSLFAYPPVETLDLLVRALAVLVVWPLFAYLSAWVLSGTSRSHIAWGGVMAGSLLLFPIGAGGIVGLLNGALDDSPDATHDAVIVEKYTSKSKNKTNYHVRCASWRPGGGTITYGVASTEYNAIVPHRSKVVVVTRAGWLGVEWLKSRRVEVNPKP